MPQPSIKRYQFETGVYRPPSEGGHFSLLVRFTRNCPWNHCGFCAMYKTEKFELRTLAEIKRDIDAIAAICEDLRRFSIQLGQGENISRNAALALIDKVPELNYHHGFAMVYNWLISGAGTVFLQDANSIIMKTDQLVEALRYLRKTFPSIYRVTTYARSKTLKQKSIQDLKTIRKAGLDRLHVGLETGDDTLLKQIKKGANADIHIEGGQKAISAGFQLSEYWMPGLGGKALWEAHAINTAKVLNAINPHYIRSRPLHPAPRTPLFQNLQKKTFMMLSPKEQLLELKKMITTLNVTSKVCFDHAGNNWRDSSGALLFTHSYEGYKFPHEKKKVLARIEEGFRANNHYKPSQKKDFGSRSRRR